MNGSLLEHLRAQLGNAVDPRSSVSVRASHVRRAAETATDLRDLARVAGAVLSSGRIADAMAARYGDGEARERQELRAQAFELRDLADVPGLLPHRVVTDGGTGYGPAPLIRQAADTWNLGLSGGVPVVPAFPSGGPFAQADPPLPFEPGVDVGVITNVEVLDGRHMSMLVTEASRLVMDSITPDGKRMLDQVVLDDVDAVAEADVAARLVAAAGGTRAAATDLAGALEDAEGAAGARGVPAWMVVAPEDWPAVRRALPATFYEGPHPLPMVSAGQPVGTVTYVGRGAVLLMADDVATMQEDTPGLVSKSVAVARPYYFQVRDGAGIQTVTGVGA